MKKLKCPDVGMIRLLIGTCKLIEDWNGEYCYLVIHGHISVKLLIVLGASL
jgi:hypothetical protein